MCFNIGPFRDNILCDVVSMSSYHVLLGRPWKFDREAIYDYRINLITIEKGGQKFTLASFKEKEEVKNLSLETSYSTEKLVAEVILEGGMNLQKDFIDKSDNKIEPDDIKLKMTNQMKSCGRKKSKL